MLKLSKTKSFLIAALLVFAMICAISGVSAAPQTIYAGNVTVTNGMFALTHDVPSWPSTDPTGDFVPAASALGALREKSLEDANFTYNASYDNLTGVIGITDINGVSGANKTWYAFVKNGSSYVYAGNVVNQAADNQKIIYLFAPMGLGTNYNAINGSATERVNLTVDIEPPAYNISGTVNVSSGATGLDVLNASVNQGIIGSYNVTWVPDYEDPAVQYAWLVDINGISSYNWTQTGYGYGLVKDNVDTQSLDQTFFTANSTYNIFMGASIYGGYYNGTSANGYYTNGVTESLSLNVRIV